MKRPRPRMFVSAAVLAATTALVCCGGCDKGSGGSGTGSGAGKTEGAGPGGDKKDKSPEQKKDENQGVVDPNPRERP